MPRAYNPHRNLRLAQVGTGQPIEISGAIVPRATWCEIRQDGMRDVVESYEHGTASSLSRRHALLWCNGRGKRKG